MQNALPMQMIGSEDVDKTWIDMLRLYKLEAETR